MSAGEAQRISLARAFLRHAELFVLDEPTAHLDGLLAAELAQVIRRLTAGATTLAVTHRLELVHAADRVVQIDNGRVSAPQRSRRPHEPDHAGDESPRCGRPGSGSRLPVAALGDDLATIALGAALLGTSGYLISRAAERPPILALGVAMVLVRAFSVGRAIMRYLERLTSHELALGALARLRAGFVARLIPLVPAGLPRVCGPRT